VTSLLLPLTQTDATRQALAMLRDPHRLSWGILPFLGFVTYVYAQEVERKRYDVVAAGLAFFLMDAFNELVNSAWLHASGRAALWTVTGPTSYLILVGWAIEIVLLFLVSGIVFVKMLPADRHLKVLGIPNRWLAITWWSCFCVAIEVFLRSAGIFHWSWWYWNVPFLLPIVVLGYGTFFWIAATVYDLGSDRRRFTVIAAMLGVDAGLALALGIAGWL